MIFVVFQWMSALMVVKKLVVITAVSSRIGAKYT
jgi:hypothetical protein